MLRTLPTVDEPAEPPDEVFGLSRQMGTAKPSACCSTDIMIASFATQCVCWGHVKMLMMPWRPLFLELWRRRSDVRIVNGSVLPWSLATVTNVCRNLSRSLRRHRAFLARLPREADCPDPADVLADSTLLGIDAELREALRALPEHDLVLFSMVSLLGYSIPDAAAALGIGVPAAKSRLLRARRRLKQSLAGKTELPTDLQASLEVQP